MSGRKRTETESENLSLRFKLHKAQMDFITSDARYRAFIGGIGSGKTFIGCLESIRIALNNPNSLGAIVAPTYSMLRDATMRTFFDLCPKNVYRTSDWRKADKELTLLNGSSILFRSANEPENLRGPNLDWFYLDEASILPDSTAWNILIGRMRAADKVNKGFITCTPKGKNYVYSLFIENPIKNSAVFHATTLDNAENLDQTALESIISSYSGQFLRQEIYGEFVSFEGLVYPEFDYKIHVVNEPEPTVRRIAGIDFGMINPTAFLVIGITTDNRLCVLDEIYVKNKTLNDLIPILLVKQEQHGIECIYADPTSPDLIKMMEVAGLRVKPAKNELISGLMEVSSKLKVKDGKPNLTILRSCVNTISEFTQYRYPEGGAGESPIKANDHAMDALRYAIMGVAQRNNPKRFKKALFIERRW